MPNRPKQDSDHDDLRLVGLFVATNFVAPPLIHQAAISLAEHGWTQTAQNVERWTEPVLRTAFFYNSLHRQRHRLPKDEGPRVVREG